MPLSLMREDETPHLTPGTDSPTPFPMRPFPTPLLQGATALLVLLMLPGCASSPPCPGPAAETPEDRILVVRHRWHTGIILPADMVREEMPFLAEEFGTDHEWFKFGWGDDEFYPDPRVRPWSIARALFWPTDVVIHVVAKEQHPARYPFTGLKEVPLSREQQRQLAESIAAQFGKEGEESLEAVADGLYLDSAFYPARGTFTAWRTCNTWTANRLRDADVPVRSFMTLTSGSMMRQLAGVENSCHIAP